MEVFVDALWTSALASDSPSLFFMQLHDSACALNALNKEGVTPLARLSQAAASSLARDHLVLVIQALLAR
jgi:hypothetical protein